MKGTISQVTSRGGEEDRGEVGRVKQSMKTCDENFSQRGFKIAFSLDKYKRKKATRVSAVSKKNVRRKESGKASVR